MRTKFQKVKLKPSNRSGKISSKSNGHVLAFIHLKSVEEAFNTVEGGDNLTASDAYPQSPHVSRFVDQSPIAKLNRAGSGSFLL